MTKSQKVFLRSVRSYLQHLESCRPFASTGETPWEVHSEFASMHELLAQLEEETLDGPTAVLESYWRLSKAPKGTLVHLGWAEVEGLAQEF